MYGLAILMFMGSPKSVHSADLRLNVTRDKVRIERGHTVAWEQKWPPSEAESASSVEFRQNDVFVVWDKRGLTIRSAGKPFNTAFRDVPTSLRLRSQSDIDATLEAHTQNGRILTASALSGALRIGRYVYLVPRWEDHPGEGWLEALVQVDMYDKNPRPVVLAILPGVAFSSRSIDSRLVRHGTSLDELVHGTNGFGLYSFDVSKGLGDYHDIGKAPKFASFLADGRVAFVEKRSFGGYYAGLFGRLSKKRMDLYQSATLPSFASLVRPIIRDGSVLVDLESGGCFVAPRDCAVLDSPLGTVVMEGQKSPKKAWLLDPRDWTPLAWWPAKAAPTQ